MFPLRTSSSFSARTPVVALGWCWLITLLIASLRSHAYAADPGMDTSAAQANLPIRLHRAGVEPAHHLDRGYDNLLANRLEAARSDYEQARKADPKNADALLGLATIARREHRAGEADELYRLALEADPTNTVALAALLGKATGVNTALAESQLKNLLSVHPQSGPLYFVLGNIYSRQTRWRDAQQAYVNALAGDGDNPDYLFNVAVSLEHLRQPALAARHYRLALDAADRRSPAFDREQARKRLRNLQP